MMINKNTNYLLEFFKFEFFDSKVASFIEDF
jgi:hypothetical protein